MDTLKFLKEHREEVIAYFEKNIKDVYNVNLKYFMTDLMTNFRKISTREELVKYDLFANLDETRSRMGRFYIPTEKVYSKPYSESNHAKAVAYFGREQVRIMSNAK